MSHIKSNTYLHADNTWKKGIYNLAHMYWKLLLKDLLFISETQLKTKLIFH